MFEEYITKTWICPKCGETSKVLVEEVRRSVYEKTPEYGGDISLFELLRFVDSKLKVTCYKCGSECYRE